MTKKETELMKRIAEVLEQSEFKVRTTSFIYLMEQLVEVIERERVSNS